MFEEILSKVSTLRAFLNHEALAEPPETSSWFNYLATIRDTLGNLSNSLSFVATVMAKEYLAERFHLREFDAGAKPQGARGPDILVSTDSGETIRCEIKTNKPYQPGFGAQQKEQVIKDLKTLSDSTARHKFMMVTDTDSFKALCRNNFAKYARGIEIINLQSKETFTHP